MHTSPIRSLVLAPLVFVAATLPVFAQVGTGAGQDDQTGGNPPDVGLPQPEPPPGFEFEGDEIPSWSTWWLLNQEHFLNLRAHVYSEGTAVDYDQGYYVGKGSRNQARRSVLKPTAEDIAETVLPLLEKTLAEDRSTPVQKACLIALGRAARTQDQGEQGDLGEQERILGVIQSHLSDANAEVAESAVMAMGILGHFTGAQALVQLVSDTPTGRDLVGRGEVPYRTRAFAAYALGLLGERTANEDVRRYVVSHLVRAMADDEGRWDDLAVACVLAIGSVPLADGGEEFDKDDDPIPASASRVGQIRFLLDLYQDRFQDKLTRAHAADAIGKIFLTFPPPRRERLKMQVAPVLLHEVRRGSDASREILESTVLALGSLGDDDDDPSDRAIRQALIKFEELHRDREATNFAMLSLARSGARPGIGQNPGGGLDNVQRLLVNQVTRGASAHRPWAALSMGILTRGLRSRGFEPPAQITMAVRSALRSSNSPEQAGAYCLAAGLIADPTAVQHLERHLVKTRNDTVRSFAALGLALIPAMDKVEAINDLLREAKHRPVLVESLAIAKALLNDRDAVPEIAGYLSEARSLDSRNALLTALGRVGDVWAIESLVELIGRPTVSSEVRSVAVMALGMVCEPDALPWSATVSLGVNFMAPTETLLSGDGRGLLEMR